jgi:hypothetical protein
MVSEPHVNGTEFGELQLAIWKEQFQASRDGDRFFYLNDPLQSYIRQNFGIDSRRTLAQVIASNTDIPLAELPANVFLLPAGAAAAAAVAPEVAVAPPVSTQLTRGDSRGKAPAPALNPIPATVSVKRSR